MFLAMSGGALAACTPTGGTVDCSGDVSAGIGLTAPYSALSVHDVTTDITPTLGTSGIVFQVNGPVAITSDTGSHAISVAGTDADGILAQSYDTSAVSIDHTGDITSADGYGVFASGQGPISSTTDGMISAEFDAIRLRSFAARDGGSGDITVSHTGDLASAAGDGIFATTQFGITQSGVGNINAYGDGIHLESYFPGTLSINQSGNITSTTGDGVFASTQGDIAEKTRGTIDAHGDGIHLKGYDVGNITVDHAGGPITSATGAGVNVDTQGNIDVSVTGAITAGTTGIHALSTGTGPTTVSVVHSGGTVTANHGNGIEASASTGSVTIHNDGKVDASGDGINAQNTSAHAVEVTLTNGTVTAGGRGIYAYSSSGDVTIDATANIRSAGEGVLATSTGGGVDVTLDGTVTTSGSGVRGIVLSAPSSGATLHDSGAIVSDGDAIFVTANGPSAPVIITRDPLAGDITSTNGKGIYARSASGSVYVTNNGAISAKDDAIYLESDGQATAASVWQSGDILSSNGYGVRDTTAQGPVAVNVWGNIQSRLDGVNAQDTGPGNVNVYVSKNINSTDGRGVYAFSSNGAVSVTVDGSVTARQEGIYAGNNGSGGLITVKASGDVTSQTSDGIYAGRTPSSDTATPVFVQAAGDVTGATNGVHLGGSAGLTFENDGGTVSGATGVFFEGGANNEILNKGTITSTDGIAGLAIKTTLSNTSIDNYGTVTGNLALSPWTNNFSNFGNAVFNMGGTVDLGNLGNALSNSGTLSPGGVGVVATTIVNGSLYNGKTGTLLMDVDLVNGTADQINVKGEGRLDGTVVGHFVNFSGAPQTFKLVHADGYINTRDMILSPSNPMILGSVTYPNSFEADLRIDGFDFAPAGLSGNARSMGKYLDTAVQSSPALYPIAVGLLNLGSEQEIEQAFAQLQPQINAGDEKQAMVVLNDFTSHLFSCHIAKGDYLTSEGECNWYNAEIGGLSKTDGGNPVYSGRSMSVLGGHQIKLGQDLRLDIGGGLTQLDSSQGSSTTNAATIRAGAALKYVPGPLLLAGSLSGSYTYNQTARDVSFGGFTDSLKGSNGVGVVDARVRAGYTFQREDDLYANAVYVKPQVDLDAYLVNTGDYTESGGPAALFIKGGTKGIASVSPSVEIGGQVVTDDNVVVRPFVRGGATLYSDPSVQLQAGLVADAGGAAPFVYSSSSDSLLWNFSAGIDLLRSTGETGQIYYNRTVGATTDAQSGGLKLSVDF